MNNDTIKLHRQAVGFLWGLAIEYAIGMYINLFVQFPNNATESQLWGFSLSTLPVALHIIVGIGLLIGSIVFMVRVNHSQSYGWRSPSRLAFAGILLSGLAGSRFIPTQSAIYSYWMSLCFLLAFASLYWGLYNDR